MDIERVLIISENTRESNILTIAILSNIDEYLNSNSCGAVSLNIKSHPISTIFLESLVILTISLIVSPIAPRRSSCFSLSFSSSFASASTLSTFFSSVFAVIVVVSLSFSSSLFSVSLFLFVVHLLLVVLF